MESDGSDASDAGDAVQETALSGGGDASGLESDDPRARWRVMAEPVRPETWVAEHDTEPLPESLLAVEASREGEGRRYLVERGGGLGA
ncbi:hypothetical protein PP1_029780 [Pseudonocardia sp. P1]|nr:hypothetical protein Ae707Ps1_5926 [Pseudonocardia sp. Ae707_Ps1]